MDRPQKRLLQAMTRSGQDAFREIANPRQAGKFIVHFRIKASIAPSWIWASALQLCNVGNVSHNTEMY